MKGIDWNRYAQLCEDTVAPAIGRFEQALRTASGVATNQSIPIYAGWMKGSMITVLRRITDILKQFAQTQLAEDALKNIQWRDVEDRMREAYLTRLCSIDNLVIAVEYANSRLYNQPSDLNRVYQWVEHLPDHKDEIDRIVRQMTDQAAAFVQKDVPDIFETAQMALRLR